MDDKFSFRTIKDFDNHINNSIKGYDILHDLIINLSSYYIKENSLLPVVDLGCTSGKLIKNIKDVFGIEGIGYDLTDNNFLEGLDLRVCDITSKDFVIPECQIVYSVFTFQFIPFEYRLQLMKKVYESLVKGGAFVFCEKEYAETGKFQEIYTFINYNNKQNNFTGDEILKKERDIRTLMMPNTRSENIKLIQNAGFTSMDIFFKSLNFTGYLIQK